MTDEDEGRVQVLVVLLRVTAIKLFRFSTVYSKEVGSGIFGPQWFDKLFDGGADAGSRYQRWSTSCHDNRTGWAHHFGSIWTIAGSCGWGSSVGPSGESVSIGVIVAGGFETLQELALDSDQPTHVRRFPTTARDQPVGQVDRFLPRPAVSSGA